MRQNSKFTPRTKNVVCAATLAFACLCFTNVGSLSGEEIPAEASNANSANEDSGFYHRASLWEVRSNVVLLIRSGPGQNYPSVGSFRKGNRFYGIDLDNGWIRLDNDTFVMNSNHITKISSPLEYVVKSPTLNVRIRPGMNQRIVGRLSQGETVRLTLIQNGWGKIRDNAWVSLEHLEPVRRSPFQVSAGSLEAESFSNSVNFSNSVAMASNNGSTQSSRCYRCCRPGKHRCIFNGRLLRWWW